MDAQMGSAVTTKTFTRDNLTCTATIDPDGKHEIAISGTIACPMYWPGDAYDLEGNEIQIVKPHKLIHAQDLIREAELWIGQNAPRKTRKARR